MECNKDEAFKAKELAEKKFINKDIVGAMRFALKARSLYPKHEGIDRMISTMDIHIASGKEPHKILQVNKCADIATLRRRYLNLVLELHPDKNKSVGASGAFQIVDKAYRVMCEEAEKPPKDQNTNSTMFQKTTQATKPKPFVTTPDNAFNGSGAKSAPEATRKNQQNGGAPNVGPAPASTPTSVPRGKTKKSEPSTYISNAKTKKTRLCRKVEPITFWTLCDKCSVMFEYRRIYLNQHLVCRNCQKSYIAIEIKTAGMS